MIHRLRIDQRRLGSFAGRRMRHRRPIPIAALALALCVLLGGPMAHSKPIGVDHSVDYLGGRCSVRTHANAFTDTVEHVSLICIDEERACGFLVEYHISIPGVDLYVFDESVAAEHDEEVRIDLRIDNQEPVWFMGKWKTYGMPFQAAFTPVLGDEMTKLLTSLHSVRDSITYSAGGFWEGRSLSMYLPPEMPLLLEEFVRRSQEFNNMASEEVNEGN